MENDIRRLGQLAAVLGTSVTVMTKPRFPTDVPSTSSMSFRLKRVLKRGVGKGTEETAKIENADAHRTSMNMAKDRYTDRERGKCFRTVGYRMVRSLRLVSSRGM